jgi:ribonuclease VapC
VIVDSSALVAILQLEPEAERLARALARDSIRLISAANWLEASIVVFLRVGGEGLRDLDLLTAKYRVETVQVTPGQAEIARRAFLQFGKGIHPARLNFGDCFAYALSKETGEPLLFKGEDFGKTDIETVPY